MSCFPPFGLKTIPDGSEDDKVCEPLRPQSPRLKVIPGNSALEDSAKEEMEARMAESRSLR